MDESMVAGIIVGSVAALVGGFACWLSFVPMGAYEWLVRRRLTWWGVETKLVDEAKFRRMAGQVGLLLFVIMGVVLYIGWECMKSGNG